MHSVWHRRLLLVALLLSLCAPTRAANALNLVTEEYPPFNMRDVKSGAFNGIAVDKVKELMHRSKQAYSLKLFPWSRAYQLALQIEDTCVFSTTRTPEREALFRWVGPLVQNNWMIFARADDTRAPKSLDDMHGYVIGGYQSDAVGEYLRIKGYKVDLAAADADNPRKLLHNRFDFWATGEQLGAWIIAQGGYAGKILPLFTFKQTEMYLACNLKTEAKKIAAFNQIIAEMEKDGTMSAIELKYR